MKGLGRLWASQLSSRFPHPYATCIISFYPCSKRALRYLPLSGSWHNASPPNAPAFQTGCLISIAPWIRSEGLWGEAANLCRGLLRVLSVSDQAEVDQNACDLPISLRLSPQNAHEVSSNMVHPKNTAMPKCASPVFKPRAASAQGQRVRKTLEPAPSIPDKAPAAFMSLRLAKLEMVKRLCPLSCRAVHANNTEAHN